MPELQTRYTRLDARLRRKFLKLLAANGGIVVHACRDLGVSRDKMYILRAKNKRFRRAWAEAIDRGMDRLEDEARRRALDGAEEPIYYKGELIGHARHPSDQLLALLLKAHRPAFRDRQEITGAGGEPLVPSVTIYLPDNERDPVPTNGNRIPEEDREEDPILAAPRGRPK